MILRHLLVNMTDSNVAHVEDFRSRVCSAEMSGKHLASRLDGPKCRKATRALHICDVGGVDMSRIVPS
jgi:hypothetical protein